MNECLFGDQPVRLEKNAYLCCRYADRVGGLLAFRTEGKAQIVVKGAQKGEGREEQDGGGRADLREAKEKEEPRRKVKVSGGERVKW